MRPKAIVFVVAVAVLGGVVLLSLMVGRQAIPPGEVIRALLSSADGNTADIVRGLRLERTVVGLVAGIACSSSSTGNLVGRDWTDVRMIGGILVAGIAMFVALSRPLSLSEFSDEKSMSLGLSASRTRLAVVTAGVLLASGAVAVAGPIQFIALTAAGRAQAHRRSGREPRRVRPDRRAAARRRRLRGAGGVPAAATAGGRAHRPRRRRLSGLAARPRMAEGPDLTPRRGNPQ